MNSFQELAKLIQPINELETEPAAKLCDLVLAFLINPASSNFQSSLGDFAEEFRIGSSVLKSISQGLIVFLQEAMHNGYGMQAMEERCQQLGFNESITKLLIKLWKKKSPQMASSLLLRSLSKNTLVDMDWSFGVTAASDDCDHVGKTYLQLKLTIDKGGEGLEDVFLELSLEQFYQFLASLEKCKSYLDYVSPTST